MREFTSYVFSEEKVESSLKIENLRLIALWSNEIKGLICLGRCKHGRFKPCKNCDSPLCWGSVLGGMACFFALQDIYRTDNREKQPKRENRNRQKSGKAAQNAEVGFYVKQDTLGVNERTPVRLGTKWKVERLNE